MGRTATAPGEPTPTVTNTLPSMASLWGVAETREAPLNEGASLIFGTGQKRAPSVVSENAQGGQSKKEFSISACPWYEDLNHNR